MPTTVTKTVKSSGGDYTSLSAWEAGEQGDLPTLDEIRQAECYSFDDTTAVSIDGWTTDATRYVRVYTPAAERHDGKWNTGKYRLSVSSANNAIINWEDFVRVVGLQIHYTQSSGSNSAFRNLGGATSEVHLSDCVIRGTISGTFAGHGIRNTPTAGGVMKAHNIVVYDFINGTTTIAGVISSSGTLYCYNTTAHNCYYGYWGGTIVLKNCIAQDCTDGFVPGDFTGSVNNCSDIASDAPGSNPQTGEVTFVDEANDDFHLDSGDTVAKDNGADLSADANIAFSDDIDGDTRSGTWDIGADEVTVASGDMSGSVSLSLTPSATLTGSGALAGSAALSLTPSATLGGFGALAGSTTITLSPDATLSGFGALAGSTSLTLSPDGTMVAFGSLAGSADVSLTPSGTLIGFGALGGAITITLSPSGTLTDGSGDGDMSGSSSISLTPSGTLSGFGALSGSISISLTLSATAADPYDDQSYNIIPVKDARELLGPHISPGDSYVLGTDPFGNKGWKKDENFVRNVGPLSKAFSVSSSLWVWNHGLGFKPMVEVRNSLGKVIPVVGIQHLSDNALQIEFTYSETGTVIIR